MEVDIVIAGAGPAGLSLAENLSHSFKVAVIDKRAIPLTTASWYSFKDRMQKLKLSHAVDRYIPKTVFAGRYEEVCYKDKQVIVNEERVLRHWAEGIKSNGSYIFPFAPFKSRKRKNNNIYVKAKNKDFKAKLLIDCMGAHSSLSKKYRTDYFYNWRVYGMDLVLKNKRFDEDAIKFFPVVKKGKPIYLGIYPRGKLNYTIYMFDYNKKYIKPDKKYADLFKRKLKEYKVPVKKFKKAVFGNIFSGNLEKYAEDNVLFYGDAGLSTPHSIGMGFNEILRTHGDVSNHIRTQFHKNNFSAYQLDHILYDSRHNFRNSFNEFADNIFYYGDIRIYDLGIKAFKISGNEFVKKWMRNELTPSLIRKGLQGVKEGIGLKNLVNMLPRKLFVRGVGLFYKSMKNYAFHEAHKIFHRHYGKKHCELCMCKDRAELCE